MDTAKTYEKQVFKLDDELKELREQFKLVEAGKEVPLKCM